MKIILTLALGYIILLFFLFVFTLYMILKAISEGVNIWEETIN